MKIKAFFSLLFLSLFSSNIAISAESQDADTINYALGLNAGWVVGNGILFRMYDNKQFYQATFVGLIDKDNDEEYLNASASYARYLNKFNYGTPVGLKWVSGAEVVYDQYQGRSDNAMNIGSGIGLDVGEVSKQGVVVSIDLIYTASFRGIRRLEFNALSLKPALGIMYNF